MKTLSLIILAMIGLALDTPVAQIGSKTIRYGEIACDPNDMRSTANEAQVTAPCRAIEQQRLEERIGHALVDAAGATEHLSATAEEVDARLRQLHLDDAHFIAAAESRKRSPQLALDYFEGRVSNAMTSVKEAIALFPNAEAARRRLKAISPAALRAVAVEKIQREITGEKVNAMLVATAAQRGADAAVVRDEYWTKMMTTIGVRILSSEYHMPTVRRDR